MADPSPPALPPLTVFISYSQDSPEFMAQILNLAARLRGEGVPCDLDQFHDSPPEGWPLWATNQIRKSTYVLTVCTRNYSLRFTGEAETGTGLGVKWEATAIIQKLYDEEARNTNVIPVVLTSEDLKHIPVPLRPYTHYNLSDKDGFPNLLRRLTARPRVEAPPISPHLRPIPDYEAEIEARMFDKEVAAEVSQYTRKLGSWPGEFVAGEDVIQPLQAILRKIEANIKYREQYRNIWATVHRMIGGAYLIHTKMEMGDKLRSSLLYLTQSQQLWPDQRGLAENVSYLETFLRTQHADLNPYFTTVLQILRGPADPQIPALVDQLVAVSKQQQSA